MNNIPITRLQPLNIFILLLFTMMCVMSVYLWEAHLGINLSDEAFLWYGAAAVNHGNVPIRDFYAYDPGRYYFTAFIMQLVGNNGIIASRIAEILVQGLGFFLALFLLIRMMEWNKRINFIYLFFAAMTLLLWMIPLYKSFDVTASIILISILTYLIEKNTLTAIFWTGVTIGIIAIIGRNHGVYGAVAGTSVIVYLSLTRHQYSIITALKYICIGVVIGYLPMILMLIFIPGFTHAFFKGIIDLILSKSTNLYLPILWPWLASTMRDFICGIFFIAILLFCFCSLSMILIKSKNKSISPTLIACAFLSLPYAQYIFSRADVIHLAIGIFPFLIGTFVFLYQVFNKSSIILLLSMMTIFILSIIVVLPLHPGAQSYHDKQWGYIDISGSQLKVDPDALNKIEMFKRLISQYAPNDQPFLVVPFNFAMYSIFKRTSPMWDFYSLFPRSFHDQADDIERIKKANPRFIVIYDEPLDGLKERQFHYTHPYIFNYIADNYELVHDISETPDVYIYINKT